MSRLAALLLFAACRSSGSPCLTMTLYEADCPSAPQGICFVDHPTAI